MDIYIPKFKELFITGCEPPSMKSGFRGEYNAILRGADGRIKYESGWKPNTLLDQGLQNICRGDRDPWSKMYLGDSNTAVDVTQTGIVGTPFASSQSSYANGASSSGSAPDYIHLTTRTCTFNAGVNTGTIYEFAFCYNSAPTTGGTVRVVLDAPIVKGASDELTIEHRLYWYPEVVDQTGTVTITGLGDYNYVMRLTQITLSITSHLYSYIPAGSGFQNNTVSSSGLSAITTYPNWTNDMAAETQVYGGSGASWYTDREYVMDVNTGNYTHGCYAVGLINGGKYWQSGGVQWSLKEVGDGVTTITKPNTHELRLGMRAYVNRYVP